MLKHKSQSEKTDCQLLENLLQVEHQELAQWLHDKMGQNLVAIKSFAAAIIEQNKDGADDTADLAEFIKQAADQSYLSTYNLMQELRAENYAEHPVNKALETCLEEARLAQQGIDYRLDVDIRLEEIDRFSLAVILRSIRSFINYIKQFSQPSTLLIELCFQNDPPGDCSLELRLSYQGEFELSSEDSTALEALRQRIEAIAGALQIKTGHQQQLDLIIRL